MTDPEVKKWLDKAGEDMRIIAHELVLSDEEIVTSAVCFHAQQAAEKYLKAFLTYKNADFGKTHVLEMLQELCSRYDNDFIKIDTGNLTDYAVQLRYPDYYYIPSADEARSAGKLADAIRKFVLKKLKPAKNSRK
ncbi:MAG TPA: HEPN domain-containing protein [bacterium]|nr:HEPN domain-containing protein [bacterium]